MKTAAYVYSCRNPGQVALRWEWQDEPFGPGWIDVKRDPLVRLSEVEAQYISLLPGIYCMDPPDGGEPTLFEQMQRMAQDAARYRWLMHTCSDVDVQEGIGWIGGEEGIDKCIREGTTE